MGDRIMDDASIKLVQAAGLPISLAAVELIVAEEDSSQDYYNRHYRHPEWPGGASGVTIGLGYDLGYATPGKIRADFAGKLPAAMVEAMVQCSGVTGERAHQLMLAVRSQIDVPWDVALDVYLHRDMPQWIATCRSYLPNFDELPPDCQGALVSLAYNRGPSFDRAGDRYAEMRQIKQAMIDKNFAAIPSRFRSMARLWPPNNGVHGRRFREAALFEVGLKARAPAAS